MIKLLIIIAIIALFMCITKNQKDGYEDSNDENCKRICFNRHPEAARMYDDEDNDVAMTTIDKCISNCKESSRSSGSSCKSCI